MLAAGHFGLGEPGAGMIEAHPSLALSGSCATWEVLGVPTPQSRDGYGDAAFQ